MTSVIFLPIQAGGLAVLQRRVEEFDRFGNDVVTVVHDLSAQWEDLVKGHVTDCRSCQVADSQGKSYRPLVAGTEGRTSIKLVGCAQPETLIGDPPPTGHQVDVVDVVLVGHFPPQHRDHPVAVLEALDRGQELPAAGGGECWTDDLALARPALEWRGRVGPVTATWSERLGGAGGFLVTVTTPTPDLMPSTLAAYDTYVLEGPSLLGGWRMVHYMASFGQQAYFVSFLAKYLDLEQRKGVMAFSANSRARLAVAFQTSRARDTARSCCP